MNGDRPLFVGAKPGAWLRPFVVAVIIWLPLCFGAWYYLSPLLSQWLAMLTEAVLPRLFPAVIAGIETMGPGLDVVTKLVPSGAPGQGVGELLFEINPLKYSFSLPLYTALVLAVPIDEDWKKLFGWLLGVMVLSAGQVFGIGAEILKVLSFNLGEEARPLLGFSPWQHEAVALCYHFGSLILPSVLPVMLWLGQFGLGLIEPESPS
ncbi:MULTISPECIES: exosortase H-associated membrane protein [Thiorhodovibrio]|uniref:exosortase H-associated membrane protein n=1 Tax=Thiorhodovibrio TaxID=61593 RepID=UPI0019129EE0|nr:MULTISPECIES: exosortase H-associated membrane protein [Thiorhodovibrio]MBK5967621.1 hypothetical protein [Thiorhodovibrio winogradskyi]WPL13074.1 hypothetical protein Thiosp_02862 [Thiorhodovibrio litoralis]